MYRRTALQPSLKRPSELPGCPEATGSSMREDWPSDAQRVERAEGSQKRAGMLSPALILRAYRCGIFPMAINQQGDIGWFSPDPRAVIPLDERFHIPHGLKRVLRKHPFRITTNTNF